MDHNEVKRYLNVIKRAVSLIEGMMDNDDGGLLEKLVENKLPETIVKVTEQEKPAIQSEPIPIKNLEEDKSFQIAREKHIKDLMEIDCWPEAVPQFLVAKDTSIEDQINRANAVLDMMLDRQLENLNFLDFGCGDGWITQQASKRGASSATGYDIKSSENWANLSGTNFTQNYKDLIASNYDVIMLYDVLDHCENPVALMSQVKNLLRKDGTVYIRCHPWTSRHATHLYKQGINKAFLHLFLSHEEIKKLINQEPNFTRPEKDPVEAYHWWFNEFEIKKERFVKEQVSEFFFVPSFKELLANEQKIDQNQVDEFLNKMQIQFADYILRLK